MENAPAFQLYAQDFLTGVMYLTHEEIGMYIKMLCKQWTDEKVPKKRLGLLVGKSWNELSDELKEKFEDHGDYVINTRIEKERQKKIAFKLKQSKNGKKGGRPSKTSKYKNPNESQKKPLEDEDRRMKNEVEEENEIIIYPGFEDFWNDYDKKVGKKSKIEKKWNLLSQQEKETIMDYIPRYIESQPDKQYRKNPETFLNNEGWNDELIKPLNGNEVTTINRQSAETFRQNGEGW